MLGEKIGSKMSSVESKKYEVPEEEFKSSLSEGDREKLRLIGIELEQYWEESRKRIRASSKVPLILNVSLECFGKKLLNLRLSLGQ